MIAHANQYNSIAAKRCNEWGMDGGGDITRGRRTPVHRSRSILPYFSAVSPNLGFSIVHWHYKSISRIMSSRLDRVTASWGLIFGAIYTVAELPRLYHVLPMPWQQRVALANWTSTAPAETWGQMTVQKASNLTRPQPIFWTEPRAWCGEKNSTGSRHWSGTKAVYQSWSCYEYEQKTRLMSKHYNFRALTLA